VRALTIFSPNVSGVAVNGAYYRLLCRAGREARGLARGNVMPLDHAVERIAIYFLVASQPLCFRAHAPAPLPRNFMHVFSPKREQLAGEISCAISRLLVLLEMRLDRSILSWSSERERGIAINSP
jgi:hypothetical protein